jgi:hypothetical protein
LRLVRTDSHGSLEKCRHLIGAGADKVCYDEERVNAETCGVAHCDDEVANAKTYPAGPIRSVHHAYRKSRGAQGEARKANKGNKGGEGEGGAKK